MRPTEIDRICKEIAEYLMEEGTEQTTNLSYIFYFEELAEIFPVDEEFLYHYDYVVDKYLDYDIVAEFTTDEESYDLVFYGNPVCKKCSEYNRRSLHNEFCQCCECWCEGMEDEDKNVVWEANE